MASIKQLLKAVEESPAGPSVAAIFDFDGTLIAGYSAVALIREQLRRGDLSTRDFAEVVSAMTNFGLGNMGFSGMMVASSQFMRGISEETYREVGEELYRKEIARLIYPESRALVEAHLAKGHTLAVISSATPYQIEPAARDLGIDHVLCTNLEVVDGAFTGGVVRPTCFGQGKVVAAEKLADQNGADLQQSFFYSDSSDDIELLERVGRPVVLNPNSKLNKIARQRDWPLARFGSRGRPTVTQFVRSVAATASLVTSFAAGLPIYALTGSRRDAINFSFSVFADTAGALIGLDLDVKGEDNLWAQRPCVFVFNHQSKADVVIMAKLIRRDIAGVGKKEIRKIPVIGRVMEMGGVVLIDRENSGSAIEAMAPLVDAIRDDGKCVVLSPEGTRTVSPRLGPFKKGAFHLAMQAGVPIVPIVIRNALDVAPKGDFVFRPATVDVEVLAPVDTSNWSTETINDHVAEVRGLFLEALGQPPAPGRQAKGKAKPTAAKRKAKPAGKAKPASTVKAKALPKSKAKPKTVTKSKPKSAVKPKSAARTKPKPTAKPKATSAAANARPKQKQR
jgi:putative phosphoserine phosphatase/1-acylglycerol-3-phosphate O-acyltransferase